ncbi:hydroxyethylthiazole kinase [bacterium]|nr:hydroxyethylthiazole kinase [bacterium]
MAAQAPLARIRAAHPLVHCISNIVTANDCANLALAVGASPMMAQAPEEMDQIAALAGAVVLNTGTPDEAKFAAACRAGAAANRCGTPVVLDPVGVGASAWRLEHIGALLKEVRPAIVRVNYGEAAALLGLEPAEHGVDSLAAPQNAAARAAALAQRLGTVVLLSGVEDLVTDGAVVLRVQGGNDRMRMVTGAGCMLSVLCGAFAAVQPDAPLAAAAGASLFWKLCAARAGQDAPGPGTLRARLMDCAAALTDEDLTAARGQIETIQ